jgi:hypothetical protein
MCVCVCVCYMIHFLICLFVDGQLGGFHILEIVSNAITMNGIKVCL